MIPTGKPDRF